MRNWVWSSVRVDRMLQLGVFPLQLGGLLLQLLLKPFDSTHLNFLPGSDLLLHIRASFLNETDQLSEDLLTVLHGFISRAIDGLRLLLKHLHVFLSVLDSLLDVFADFHLELSSASRSVLLKRRRCRGLHVHP